MPAAADIDEAITFAPGDIANIAYDTSLALSLYTQMGLWITGIFTTIFPPASDQTAYPNQRTVTDWNYTNQAALESIEGPAVGDAELPGTSNTIDAVVRTLTAVKYATINGFITGAQETLVVTLYNTCFGDPPP